MKKVLTKIRIPLTALCMTAMLACGCADTQYVLTPEINLEEVFAAGESVGTLSELRVMADALCLSYAKAYSDKVMHGSYRDDIASAIPENALADLTKTKVLSRMAAENGVVLSEAEQALALQAAEALYGGLSENEKTFCFGGKDEEQCLELLRGMYADYAAAQKMYDSIMENAAVEVSDEEARTVTVQSILIKTYDVDPYGNHIPYDDAGKAEARRRAAAILQEIRDGMAGYTGVSFDTWISRYNEAGTGTDTFGKGERDSAYEQAAFTQEPGTIGEVVETADGYRIIKVIRGSDADEIREKKEAITKLRQTQAFESAYNDYLRGVPYVLDDEAYASFSEEVGSYYDGFSKEEESLTFFEVYDWVFHG